MPDHRGLQVLDGVKQLLVTNGTWGSNVYLGQAWPLKKSDLPAALIAIGDDVPISDLGTDNMSFIDSFLSVSVVIRATAKDEATLLEALFEGRKQAHIALMADPTLGISFVTDCRYQGAAKPINNDNSDAIISDYETRWVVRYRMNYLDPG